MSLGCLALGSFPWVRLPVGSHSLVKYLCVLNQTRGSFIFCPHGQRSSQSLLGESTRPAGGQLLGSRDRDVKVSLGNAFLDSTLNFQRKRGGLSTAASGHGKSGCAAPAFRRPSALF